MEMFDLLIKRNVDVNICDNEKNTPLFEATERRSIQIEKIIKKILEKGANINWSNKKGDTPLLQAIKENNTKAACVLIDEGADLNRNDFNGFSSIDFIFTGNKEELLNSLQKRFSKSVFLKMKNTYDDKKVLKLKHKMEKMGIDFLSHNRTCDQSIHEDISDQKVDDKENKIKKIKKDIFILFSKIKILKKINKNLKKFSK
jgi:hypothetical protein